jgi:hypothetical protein
MTRNTNEYKKRNERRKYVLCSHLSKAKSRLERAKQIASLTEKEHILRAINEVDKALKSIKEEVNIE